VSPVGSTKVLEEGVRDLDISGLLALRIPPGEDEELGVVDIIKCGKV
jgi:hypothetical protein